MPVFQKRKYPSIHRLKDHPTDTAKNFQVEGHQGTVSFITSMTQHFCSGCNRLRLMADGNLKVCLFGPSEASLFEYFSQLFLMWSSHIQSDNLNARCFTCRLVYEMQFAVVLENQNCSRSSAMRYANISYLYSLSNGSRIIILLHRYF